VSVRCTPRARSARRCWRWGWRCFCRKCFSPRRQPLDRADARHRCRLSAAQALLAYAAGRRQKTIAVEIHVHPVAAHPVRVGHGGRTIPARAQQRRQKLLPELTRELRLILARVDSGLELGQELNKASVMLAVDEFTDTCVILQQLIQQGGGAMKSLLALKQLLDDRRLTRLQEYISKMSAKMSVVMMLFLFPALLIVLAGPGFTAITRAFATDVGSWSVDESTDCRGKSVDARWLCH
jgi:hypothetical protein